VQSPPFIAEDDLGGFYKKIHSIEKSPWPPFNQRGKLIR